MVRKRCKEEQREVGIGKDKKKNNKKASTGFHIKVLTGFILATIFTVTTVYAAEDLDTVYHVYIDGEHIGKVANEKVVDDAIDQKMAKAKTDNHTSLQPKQKISVISEKVFNPTFDHERVLHSIKADVTIIADAVELNIGGESVGYYTDRETAEQVVRNYVTTFVDEKNLQALASKEEDNLESSNRGDKQVTDVTISEDIDYKEKQVTPDRLSTLEQGIERLRKGMTEEKVHKVNKGEALSEIAENYNLSNKKLMDLNASLEEKSVLKIDQEITVNEQKPIAEVIVTETQLQEEKVEYETDIITSGELYKGEEKTKQEGKDGEKEVLYETETRNGNQVNKEVLNETTTEEPQKEIIIKGTKELPSRGTGELEWPAVGGQITSHMGERWGKKHKGIDIAGTSDRTIKAADNGTVVSAGFDDGGYGNKVIINHNNGMKTIYAHLSSLSVNKGDTIEKGSKIGVMGSTGNSTGVHLHFEVYKDDQRENPIDYVQN